MKPVLRVKVCELSLAFFIFLVRRDCLLRSMLPRNSFILTPSGMGSSPVLELLHELVAEGNLLGRPAAGPALAGDFAGLGILLQRHFGNLDCWSVVF